MSPAVVWPGLWQKRVLILCVHSISVVCMPRFRSRKHRYRGVWAGGVTLEEKIQRARGLQKERERSQNTATR